MGALILMAPLIILFILLSSLILVKFATQGLILCLEKLLNRKYLNYQTAFGLFFVVYGNPGILALILIISPDLLTSPTNDFLLKLIIFCLALFSIGIFTIIGLNSSKFQKKISTSLCIVPAFIALCYTFVSSGWGIAAIYGYLSRGLFVDVNGGGAVFVAICLYITGIAILLSLITTVGWFIYLLKKSGNTDHSVNLGND